MASREFLKTLGYARLGDVSAQQKLAVAYLNGDFKTPIQPSNALIWLEKSYITLINQSRDSQSASASQISELQSIIAKVPLSACFNSPAFAFGWDSFLQLAAEDGVTQFSESVRDAARWQLIHLLIDPVNQLTQLELPKWLKKRHGLGLNPQFANYELSDFKKLASQYLPVLAESQSDFAPKAKELLIKLQPKNEALSSLWNAWHKHNNEDALIQAAELGLTVAKLTLGLRLAQLDEVGSPEKKRKQKSNASLKKAAYWLELAAKDGDRDAWFALGEIYRKPQFSGYNATESDRCFDRAADLGHAQAQFRKGANLWRKREKLEEQVRGLQASYWVWQAHQQGVPEATELLGKILENTASSGQNDWHDFAMYSDKALSHAEHKLDDEWVLMCHRLIIANHFNLSKAELLLCEVSQLQHEHCVVVDIRFELPKILPRLIQINTTQQRRSLLAAGKAFAGVDAEREGNLRQRRYRFDRVTEWLHSTFAKAADGKVA
ncbi:hypothetical protein SAMN06295945_1276 [Polynucleobacter meluiroseus]|uniref:Sel1 repeat-containing protein n=1 Tax=Polynucleobacter meluiroseus TaxID=1938814 RepID=A0A240E114_9BURK|nr:sel1 repeat family protein [Polynucleobacter meluiroseus]SNX28917.1 hypothetical protein SAMN06295945_1276 [Polynucleobacter meluiroseus]